MIFIESAIVIVVINVVLVVHDYLNTKPPPRGQADTSMTIRQQFDTWPQGRVTYRYDHHHNLIKVEAKVPPEGGRAIVFKTVVGRMTADKRHTKG